MLEDTETKSASKKRPLPLREVQVPALKDADGWCCFCCGSALLLSIRKAEAINKILDSTEASCEPQSNSLDDYDEDDDDEYDDDFDNDHDEKAEIKVITKCSDDLRAVDQSGCDGNGEMLMQNQSSSLSTSSSSSSSSSQSGRVMPTIRLLFQFDQVLCQRLIEHLSTLLVRVRCCSDQLLCSHVTAIGRWIYAVLSRLHLPLHGDSAAAVRAVYVQCHVR